MIDAYGDSLAVGASLDGDLIVGFHHYDGTETPVIWDANGNAYDINVLLSALGVDLTGWRLDRALAISDDGGTIIGRGVRPDGTATGWIATIPEPSTAVLVGLGLALAARRRARMGRRF